MSSIDLRTLTSSTAMPCSAISPDRSLACELPPSHGNSPHQAGKYRWHRSKWLGEKPPAKLRPKAVAGQVWVWVWRDLGRCPGWKNQRTIRIDAVEKNGSVCATVLTTTKGQPPKSMRKTKLMPRSLYASYELVQHSRVKVSA